MKKMEKMMSSEVHKALEGDEGTSILLSSLRELIQGARQKILRAVASVQVQTCWEIGRHIVEFEQRGSARADYGSRLLQALAVVLGAEFGKGFDVSNLRYMRLFLSSGRRHDVKSERRMREMRMSGSMSGM